MTMREHPPEPPSDLEHEGIPDVEGRYPGEGATGVSWEGVVPPGDVPLGAEELRTTAAEEASDEPVALRAEREEPEVGGDEEDELVGLLEGGAVPAEEAALRVLPEDRAPGMSWDESPDYVGVEAPGGGSAEAPPAT